MSHHQKSILILLVNYLLWVGFLALGGYLLMNYPDNEALGGMVLGSAGVILGIIIPYHLKRTHVVAFKFLPSQGETGRIILYTVIFTVILVLTAGRKEFMTIIRNPPGLLPAVRRMTRTPFTSSPSGEISGTASFAANRSMART